MVRHSFHHGIRHVYIFIDGESNNELAAWNEILRSMQLISIINSPKNVHAMARLTSVMRCESYGCPTGLRPDTWGQMYIYDDWSFGISNYSYPRYYISNAIWQKEPSLLDALQWRIDILFSTITTFNFSAHDPIETLIIDKAVLGEWTNYPFEERYGAIVLLRDILSERFGII
jgi:hypothetical protein